jgi:flavin-dependent dehydrogenase
VLGRQHRTYEDGLRGQALIGLWRAADWPLADAGHTLVESWPDGWGWSVPASAERRYVGVVVDGRSSGLARSATFQSTYRAAVARMRRLFEVVGGAALEGAWACDASVYHSRRCAGPHHLVAGDAASFIEPLSSFGVKKALASGWTAAIAAHTILRHPGRARLAADFFADWERRAYVTSLQRSREYAQEAWSRYRTPFWDARAAVAAPAAFATSVDPETLLDSADVHATFERLRSGAPSLQVSPSLRTVSRPLIRGGEIVAEDAVAFGSGDGAVRYVRDIDVLTIVQLTADITDVGAVISGYIERHGEVALPTLLATISLLVARGVLVARP